MDDELPSGKEAHRGAANGSVPPYLHIADVLRGEIVDGSYPVGERIPSQAELEVRFNVSRPTVQRALGELRRDGYIDNQRGRPAEVLPWQESGGATGDWSDQPAPASTSLVAYVAEAFEQREVTIDSYSLTTETLARALVPAVQRVEQGELRPESITIRLLLPSLDTHLGVPQLVGDPTDDRPLRRLRQIVEGHVISLRSTFTALSELAPWIQRSVEFRTVPLTPMQKVYLFNGHMALGGYYRVVPREVALGDGERREIYDVLGLSAQLFPYRLDPADPGSRDSRFVQESQAWFDSLWSTIATPLKLSE